MYLIDGCAFDHYRRMQEVLRKRGPLYLRITYVGANYTMHLFVIDIETHDHPRIGRGALRPVSISWAIALPDGYLEKTENHVIRPDGWNITDGSFKIHGISQRDALLSGKPVDKVLRLLVDDMESRQPLTVIGHHAEFDIGVIQSELRRTRITYDLEQFPFICTMKTTTNVTRIPRERGRGFKWPTLQELHTELFGSNFRGAHTSHADVAATLKCYLELRRRGHYPRIPQMADQSTRSNVQASSSSRPQNSASPISPRYRREVVQGPGRDANWIAPPAVPAEYRVESIKPREGNRYAVAESTATLSYANGNAAADRRDFATAVRWWLRAAEQNHSKAQFNLGVAYSRGKGVSKDQAKALNWWRQAAARGHVGAKYQLSLVEGKNHYNQGIGQKSQENEPPATIAARRLRERVTGSRRPAVAPIGSGPETNPDFRRVLNKWLGNVCFGLAGAAMVTTWVIGFSMGVGSGLISLLIGLGVFMFALAALSNPIVTGVVVVGVFLVQLRNGLSEAAIASTIAFFAVGFCTVLVSELGGHRSWRRR